MQIEKLRGQALDELLMRFLHLKIEKNVINSLMIYALSMNYNHYLKDYKLLR